jgi:L-fucose mutarotase
MKPHNKAGVSCEVRRLQAEPKGILPLERRGFDDRQLRRGILDQGKTKHSGSKGDLNDMLRGISKFIGPELLLVLHQMGHGDEIVLADAHFPGHSLGPRVVRADGVPVCDLLDGILPLFELDSYAPPLVMMEVVPGDTLDPVVEQDYMAVIHAHTPKAAPPVRLERHDFYRRSKSAFAIVMTGEVRKYGNLILKKGVTPA